MPAKCRRRPCHGSSRGAGAPPRPDRGEHLVGDPLRGIGPRHGPRGVRHRLEPPRIADERLDLRAQARGAQLPVANHDRRARGRHPVGVLGLVVGRGVRVGDEDRGPAGRRDLEDRSAGARDHEVAGRERVRERVEVLQHRVAVPVADTRAHLREVARAGDVQNVHARVDERLGRNRVQRPGAEAAAEHQHAGRGGRHAEPLARGVAIGLQDRAGHGPPRHQPAVAGAALDREREAHPARERREHAVREPEVAVGLAQHERGAPRDRGESDRPGDVAAAREHDVRPDAGQQAPGRAGGGARARDGAERAHGVAPVQAAHREVLDRVAGRRHELRLRAVARADPDYVGASIPQLVCDRQRRHDVPGGPARCDHHGWHRPSL